MKSRTTLLCSSITRKTGMASNIKFMNQGHINFMPILDQNEALFAYYNYKYDLSTLFYTDFKCKSASFSLFFVTYSQRTSTVTINGTSTQYANEECGKCVARVESDQAFIDCCNSGKLYYRIRVALFKQVSIRAVSESACNTVQKHPETRCACG